MKIALCGCMMQEPTVIEKIKTSYRFVDLIFGTHNIFRFAELLTATFENMGMTIDIWKDTVKIVEDLPVERKYAFKSGITSSNNRIYEYVYDVDGNKIAAYTYKHDSETLVKDEEGNVISAEKGVPEFEEKWTYVDGVLTLYETNKWNTK